MATIGNLELRLGEKTLYASTTHDGHRVYEMIPKLVKFLDSANKTKNQTLVECTNWFESTSRLLLPYEYCAGLIDGVPHEVIIDIPRKLILHTGNEESYELVSENSPAKFENACIILKEKYSFEILKYVRPEMRKVR